MQVTRDMNSCIQCALDALVLEIFANSNEMDEVSGISSKSVVNNEIKSIQWFVDAINVYEM